MTPDVQDEQKLSIVADIDTLLAQLQKREARTYLPRGSRSRTLPAGMHLGSRDVNSGQALKNLTLS